MSAKSKGYRKTSRDRVRMGCFAQENVPFYSTISKHHARLTRKNYAVIGMARMSQLNIKALVNAAGI